MFVSSVLKGMQQFEINPGHICCDVKMIWDIIFCNLDWEIGSYVYSYLSELSSGAKHLVCYSDTCGGQNWNIYMLCLWLHIVHNSAFSYEIIDQKFMVSGHSYLVNDRDFGIIESAKRRSQHIYASRDYGG